MTTHKKKPRNPDHVRSRRMSGPTHEQVEQHLALLLKPAVYSQLATYQQLGLRHRLLTLPLMVAAMLTMIWQQVPSVHQLTRMLAREDLLWCRATQVSQQALNKRMLSFPYELFASVLQALLPVLHHRHAERNRPVPVAVAKARRHFRHIWIADGSTLEALFRKLDILQDKPAGVLAGKMCTLLDLCTHLPVEMFFTEQALAHDSGFWPNIRERVGAGVLLVLDRGFYDFEQFGLLLAQGSHFLTRWKQNTAYIEVQTLSKSASHKDRTVLPCCSFSRFPCRRLSLCLNRMKPLTAC